MEIKKACLIVGLALSAPASIWAQGGPMPAVTVAPGATVGVDPSQNTVRIGNLASDPALVRSVDEGSRQPGRTRVCVLLPDPLGILRGRALRGPRHP